MHPSIIDTEVFCDDYTIFRKDRVDRRGGGVLIAVRSALAAQILSMNESLNVEFIAIKIQLKSTFLYICCSYVPPNSDAVTYTAHAELISGMVNKMRTSDTCAIFGDFNLPGISWHESDDSNCLCPSRSCEFLDCMLCLPVLQVNYVKNANERLLDLIFVDPLCDVSVTRTTPFTLPEDSHHPTLELTLRFSCYESTSSTVRPLPFFNFRSANYEGLSYELSSINWSTILNTKNVDVAVKYFYDTLYDIFRQHVPVVTPSHTNTSFPWITNELRRAKNHRNRLFKKYRKTGAANDFDLYSQANHLYNNCNRISYKRYLVELRRKVTNDPMQFYKFVNMKRRSRKLPCGMRLRDGETMYGQAINSLFANVFASNYSVSDVTISDYPYYIEEGSLITPPVFDATEVWRYLQSLKLDYSSGPDSVPNAVLKFCADQLVDPLTHIFNLSMHTSTFPKEWKKSFIFPVHKKGPKDDVSNYRGIAKLSAIPKLFEHVITEQLNHSLRSLISSCQHGFFKGRSTSTNLLEFTTSINTGFSNGHQSDAVFMDFSKAFDSVNHKLLLMKLCKSGFSPALIKWLKSYLTERTQKVLVNGLLSDSIIVSSGVPQGSHLGPILFTLFINDLPPVIQFSKVLLYADDTKLLKTMDSPDARKHLQADITSVMKWCAVNNLLLNIDKCCIMSFSRREIILHTFCLGTSDLGRVEYFKDLGITLDKKLNFNTHVELTASKAKSVLGFIKRWAKEFRDPYVTKKLFTTLVRPILEYGVTIWNPQYNVHANKIESVQKQFLLFALRRLNWGSRFDLPPYQGRLMLIGLHSLEDRRRMLSTMFVFKLIIGAVDSSFLLDRICMSVPCRISRNYVPLRLPLCSSNYEAFDPFRVLCRIFNENYQSINYSMSFDECRKILLNIV